MKKSCFAVLMFFIVSCLLVSLPALAVEGTATIKAQDLLSLAGKKTYRLGLRLNTIAPTRDYQITKDSTFDFGLEFDARLNENLDTGPRIGFCTFKSKTAGYEGTYGILRFGYGARMYVMDWGGYGSSHGFANVYINGEGSYYNASKTTDVSLTSPPSFSGFGATGGAGVEFAFGPNTGAFVELDYQKTKFTASSGSGALSLDGYVLGCGARMAFF